ncbi:MAG TPA: ATP-binding protein, partial [Nannocystis exedens]|nr:ATP-binding protein [Nannocystis exedens]
PSGGKFSRSTILRFVPEKLSAPSVLTDEEPQLADDGHGLASLLDYLIGLRDGSIERIEEDLRKIIPQARRLRVLPKKIVFETVEDLGDSPYEENLRRRKDRRMGSRFELEFGAMGFIPASALSEGTLIVLGILAIIHRAADTPTVALLDDFDRGLHPRAQNELIRTLRALVEQRMNLQLLCTTHSTYALDAFSATEAHVIWMDGDGVSYHRRLSEHPEWPRWESLMDPGEFWSSVGEAWVGDAQEPA